MYRGSTDLPLLVDKEWPGEIWEQPRSPGGSKKGPSGKLLKTFVRDGSKLVLNNSGTL